MKLQALPEPPSELALELPEFLPYRLSVIANRVSRAFAALYETRFGLSIPDWRVVAVLGRQAGLSADEVCRRTEMDKVTVSRALARLDERGLLRRATAAQDRRRLVLDLTARGRRVYAEIVPLARRYEQELAAALSGRELRALDRLLEKLACRTLEMLADDEGGAGARLPTRA
ncbi:MAG: winged helix-turn-helix transcriptional regulator [Gammaproteobacteria bacterium]|nr:winged helix-turn-helix transcriptional regulator [Gammaproteobacteria bacterium]